jgi:hypothetical protein
MNRTQELPGADAKLMRENIYRTHRHAFAARP